MAAHPFSTTESTVGVAAVPDPRLTALAEMSKSKKVVPATLELVDIAGLVAGASTGEGLGNRFLAGIREVDAVVLVLRAFEDDNVVGGTDPLDDLHTLELELVLADVDSIESQLPKRQKMARADKSLAGEVEAMEAALAVLSGGTPLYRSALPPSSGPTCAPRSCSPTSPCWRWSTWARTSWTTPTGSPSRWPRSWATRPRCWA